jgi:putative transposase
MQSGMNIGNSASPFGALQPVTTIRAGTGMLAKVPEPKFALPLQSLIELDGQHMLLESKLGDKWLFVNPDTKNPEWRTDFELAQLQAQGRFRVVKTSRFNDGLAKPQSPLVVGLNDKGNLRKHAYVQACLNAAGGFRRSRGILVPIIHTVAAGRQETPPGFTTVLEWVSEHEKYFHEYGTACFTDRHDLKGKPGHKLHWVQEKALSLGVNRLLSGMTGPVAYAAVCRYIKLFDVKYGRHLDKKAMGPDAVDENGRLKPPSLSTLERRYSEVDPFVRDSMRKGLRYAKRTHRTFSTMARPDLPYQEVEVDHCTLDIQLIDTGGLVFGRPDLVTFRDRATAMIIGYGLGFEKPSYASFLRGLRHAMYPKDLSNCPSVKNPWPCFGHIQNLCVDNALHFIGDNIREAGRELGFNVTRFHKREPWAKGALERFFRTFNTGLVHSLPATTLQNASARQDHEYLGEPTFTVEEFEALLIRWICDVYHVSVRRALGPIRGVGDVPLRVWAEKAKNFVTPPVPPEEMFIELAGDWEMRVISKDGIEWDYIKYEESSLYSITSHPAHQKGMKYKVVRDPMDLGNIHIVNHHTRERIKVPASVGHYNYACGRTLHQHRVTLNNAKLLKEKWEKDHWDAIVEAKDELAKITLAVLKRPSRKKIENKVARFLDWDKGRRIRSNIAVPTPTDGSGSRYLPLEPPKQIRSATVQGGAEAVLNPRQPPPRPRIHNDLERELEEKLAQKNWGVTHV